jgi:GWxTD domain-containing protein
MRTEFLVSLSDRWVVTNLDEVANLLRYFEAQEWVAKLKNASASDRPQVWREFWKATDPTPITPENEALTEYFKRVQTANSRYREEGDPGWLTDRGEVYITLGEPDEAIELSAQQSQSGRRTMRWAYTTHRLEVFFQDETGFGRFRLTPASRAEYQRVLGRVRRTS